MIHREKQSAVIFLSGSRWLHNHITVTFLGACKCGGWLMHTQQWPWGEVVSGKPQKKTNVSIQFELGMFGPATARLMTASTASSATIASHTASLFLPLRLSWDPQQSWHHLDNAKGKGRDTTRRLPHTRPWLDVCGTVSTFETENILDSHLEVSGFALKSTETKSVSVSTLGCSRCRSSLSKCHFSSSRIWMDLTCFVPCIVSGPLSTYKRSLNVL